MTIFATNFGLVLGAWRLRIRIDLDEPRESELEEPAAVRDRRPAAEPAARRELPSFTPRGFG